MLLKTSPLLSGSLSKNSTRTTHSKRNTVGKSKNYCEQSSVIPRASLWDKSHFLTGLKTLRSYATTTNTDMFCFQCEQTRDGTGCVTTGVCGKSPETSRLQDLLMYSLIGVSMWAHRAREVGVINAEVDRFVPMASFATLTNVNFDEERFVDYVREAEALIQRIKGEYIRACEKRGVTPEVLDGPAEFRMEGQTVEELVAQGERVYSIIARQQLLGEDVVGLQELITYGLKGTSAYCDHARKLGMESVEVYGKIHEVLNFLSTTDATVDKYLEVAMDVGQLNLKVMELLDNGAVEKWGHPEPTRVLTTPVEGKCILVSGHDINDLENILKQTEGKGINVYTHGELLPAHSYPGLKKYTHLKGNYGGAWQMQKLEFSTFPGPIVMTTNCITEPRKKYRDRIFTTHVVGFPGVKHLENDDYTPVIEAALECEGFTKSMPREKYLTIGFGRNTVLSVADKIVEGVKAGHIKRFFLIGGCDGAETERHYFTDVAKNVPEDSVILTLACGKYRFNHLDLGVVPELGIPRVLDMGQCNDSFSAIQVAVGLANAFETDVNSLPLSFVVSWFEQKAVAVLLTLLSLNIQNIHLGPALPAFCTPNMLAILTEKFKLKQIGDAKTDLEAMMKQ
eukprot:TRINITY_DN9432_c0_g1_i1.p1 TRINITY_DN9432_c0_g1~~TRINITY_DN9432_c0_g1_i1.p1  ORF type:complete len:623 (+),score=129.50 TRINITY_DN9432_c0_g1_i1:69-1937(+)